jgi:hypothetical protein
MPARVRRVLAPLTSRSPPPGSAGHEDRGLMGHHEAIPFTPELVSHSPPDVDDTRRPKQSERDHLRSWPACCPPGSVTLSVYPGLMAWSSCPRCRRRCEGPCRKNPVLLTAVGHRLRAAMRNPPPGGPQ